MGMQMLLKMDIKLQTLLKKADLDTCELEALHCWVLLHQPGQWNWNAGVGVILELNLDEKKWIEWLNATSSIHSGFVYLSPFAAIGRQILHPLRRTQFGQYQASSSATLGPPGSSYWQQTHPFKASLQLSVNTAYQHTLPRLFNTKQ